MQPGEFFAHPATHTHVLSELTARRWVFVVLVRPDAVRPVKALRIRVKPRRRRRPQRSSARRD